MHIEFGDQATWIENRSSIYFYAKVNGKTVKCFVSRVALEDHCGGDGVSDYVPIFNAHRKKILLVAEKMIQAGLISPAGELIVATEFFS